MTNKKYVSYDDVYQMMIERGLSKREASKQTKAYVKDYNDGIDEEYKDITEALSKSIKYFDGLRKDYRSDKNLPLIVAYLSRMLNKY
jgi:hypothetical protein